MKNLRKPFNKKEKGSFGTEGEKGKVFQVTAVKII
jgi:hypothetical protein